jgi:hypothetical protein
MAMYVRYEEKSIGSELNFLEVRGWKLEVRRHIVRVLRFPVKADFVRWVAHPLAIPARTSDIGHRKNQISHFIRNDIVRVAGICTPAIAPECVR